MYDEYYKARKEILSIMREDLLGPVDENETITESPVSYYLVGKLYPRSIAKIDEDEQVTVDVESSFHEEEMLALGNGNYPSAMGITFAVSKDTELLNISAKAAGYDYLDEKKEWRRKIYETKFDLNLDELLKNKSVNFVLHNQLEVQARLFQYKGIANYKITITLVNKSYSESYSYVNLSKATYFQPELIVTIPYQGRFVEISLRNWDNSDEEDKNLEMLYSNRNAYAVGHGCSAVWEEAEVVKSVRMEVLPEYNLNQMKPSSCINSEILSMKYLAEADYSQIRAGLLQFTEKYQMWIAGKESEAKRIEKRYHDTAEDNISKCRETNERLKKGIELLEDTDVFWAFQLSNKAMMLQRKNTTGCPAEHARWYPFQLAFFLLELESIVNKKTEYRSVVDLLWFPTGGGKTEAYLGIAAFTIFYRRITAEIAGRKDDGVAVLMRYTLRLLSFQQFERAAAMICAAEVIRQEEKIAGKPFSIGLWAGGDLTPNKLKEADDYLNRGPSSKISNPVQLKKCPFCQRKLNQSDYDVDFRRKKMIISCSDEKCHFHTGIPVQMIDEEIYFNKPSFLIGTIDKFAQLAFNENAGELLGVDSNQSLDLIIQDELHLISGPLGTVSGIYEAAILKLCEKDGIKPKIIASTATIKNAADQILQLYGQEYRQFPPQGLLMDDSFFAELSTREMKADRKYVGVLTAGTSRAVTFNWVVSSLLFATRYLEERGYAEKVIDSFWTQTGYFNTLKELGSALVRIVDSVQDRFWYLANTKFSKKYPVNNYKRRYDKFYEMTSRNSSVDLGSAIQNELMISYDKEHKNVPYDFLIASNMISVGVDVSRLNSMVVVGQPMKTAEYIQSSSRVGRTTPGIVFVLYHPAKSRDRSHYEQFMQYHSTLYRYVEATSVTPFAERARDRALQALYIILCRYMIPNLRKNEDAKNFTRDISILKDIREYILNHVGKIDSEEAVYVEKELNELEYLWEEKARKNKQLVYSDYMRSEEVLYDKDYEEGSRFRMMNSMRSVETAIDVYTEE